MRSPPKPVPKSTSGSNTTGSALHGKTAAALLLAQQLEGRAKAAAAGMLVKVNFVYIPGVNDHETLDLAVKVRGLGASMMNIMPVIPVGKFKDVERPSEATMEMVRNQAELILSQARHCKQCRADAAGVVGQDIDLPSSTPVSGMAAPRATLQSWPCSASTRQP
jgi:nitrogen fixation protein NifB